jgi:selenocysteine lyase/cysteine desulfurase
MFSLYKDKDGGVYQRLAPATCIMLVASTNTGKSYLINQWLENLHHVFQQEPDEIVYIYEEHTSNKEQMDRLSSKMNITFVEGFPKDSEQLTNGSLFRHPRTKDTHRLLILDDVYAQAVASKHMARFCTTYAHHHQVIVMVI